MDGVHHNQNIKHSHVSAEQKNIIWKFTKEIKKCSTLFTIMNVFVQCLLYSH